MLETANTTTAGERGVRRLNRRWRAAMVTVSLLSFLLIGAGPASAETNPYTPERICGAGYKRVAKGAYPLVINGEKVATTYVMYKASTGRNCVTTVKNKWVGRPTYIWAGLRLSSDDSGWNNKYDAGYYKYYAVAPTKSARNKCIDVWGGAYTAAGNTYADVYRTDVFCG